MIVKVYNTNKYVVVKSLNELHYYREIMRLKLNHINHQENTKKRIQDKINFFSS
jgi:mannose-6-phosphate isomerase class I